VSSMRVCCGTMYSIGSVAGRMADKCKGSGRQISQRLQRSSSCQANPRYLLPCRSVLSTSRRSCCPS
jgi:hypothetical protein